MDDLQHDGKGGVFLGLRLSAQTAALAIVPLVLFLLRRLLSQKFDPREPPVLEPRIPFIGHIVSLIRESTNYFYRLQKERPTPICTLPMLNGKIYMVHSPSLIASAMRNKDVSFEPLMLEFGEKIGGLTKRLMEMVSGPGSIDRIAHVVHSTLTAGSLSNMTNRALAELKQRVNAIEAPGTTSAVDIPDVSLWLRKLMVKATFVGLFGKNDPMTDQATQDLWDFDQNFSMLVLGVAPELVAPKAFNARKRLQATLAEFYKAQLYKGDDVSALIAERAVIHREFGYSDEDLGTSEFSMPWAATTNTPLTLIWLFVCIFSRPALLERIRPEVEGVITTAGTTATLDVGRMEKQCPTLMACFREALRLYDDNTANRKIVKDTTIQDADGRQYLLKEGTTLQWLAGIAHLDESVWGADAREFNPDRWLRATAQDEKRRRLAFIPFGGGRNLCPGRYFAQAEILALVGCLAVGFEVEGLQMPRALQTPMGTAMRPASWEGLDPSVKLRRRSGWADVVWDFKY